VFRPILVKNKMNSSAVSDDKLKKLSLLYRSCLDRWQNQVRAGKSLLDSILEIRYMVGHSFNSRVPDFRIVFYRQLAASPTNTK
jgi:hypothetical protein